jgi:hypothetical protein
MFLPHVNGSILALGGLRNVSLSNLLFLPCERFRLSICQL